MRENNRVRRAVAVLLLIPGTVILACAPSAPTTQPPTQVAKPPSAPAPLASPVPAQPSPLASVVASPAATPTAIVAPSPAVSRVANPVAAGLVARTFNESSVANFYRGKTVRVIVGYGAGGGYDTYSRVIGRYLGKYIPGEPTVIVENMPGAGGLLAATSVANTLPKDGTAIANFAITGVFDGLVSGQKTDFDPATMNYLNMPSIDDISCVVTRRSGITSFQEVLGPHSKQMIAGSSSGAPDEAGILAATLGANIRRIAGYNGTAAIRLAMDQGEVDGQCQWSWQSISSTALDRIQSGDYVVIAQVVGDQLNKAYPPTMPLASSLAQTEEARQLLLYGMTLPRQYQREYAVAAEVPMDRVQALRTAFDRALTDPDLLADAQRSNLDIGPISGEAAGQRVKELIAMPDNVRSKLKEIAAQP